MKITSGDGFITAGETYDNGTNEPVDGLVIKIDAGGN
jgi:hypothetical protein